MEKKILVEMTFLRPTQEEFTEYEIASFLLSMEMKFNEVSRNRVHIFIKEEKGDRG